MALTGKKRAFANAVLAGLSNKQAAVKAGYSIKTAGPAGSRLAKDPDVVAHLAALRKKGGKEVEQRMDKAAPVVVEPPPKPTFDINLALMHTDPRAFLMAAMNDGALEPRQRIDAAKALMPFMHQKLGEGGKKDQKQAAAEKVASRFAAGAPPKLVAAGGKKI
jgi:phage terminase small subunit